MNDQLPKGPSGDSALAVWLKLLAILAGLTAFGFLAYSLARWAHP